MNRTLDLVCVVIGIAAGLNTAHAAEPIYQTDFQSTAVGEVPDDFLVLDGQFAVREDGDNKVLELPGAPLESYGCLFGPAKKEDIAVSGRIFGTNRGRRYPTFALSVNGVGGYRLRVSPAKRAVELYKGDTALTDVPHTWKAGGWTLLKLQIVKAGDSSWKIQGKVWPDGEAEPAEWTIEWEETEEPFAGKAGLWGAPYAGTPIRYDDIKVTSVVK